MRGPPPPGQPKPAGETEAGVSGRWAIVHRVGRFNSLRAFFKEQYSGGLDSLRGPELTCACDPTMSAIRGRPDMLNRPAGV